MNRYTDLLFVWSEKIRRRLTITPTAFALFAVSIGIICKSLLSPFLGDNSPLLIFIIAILVSGWYGGLYPVLLATTLSIITGYIIYTDPTYTFTYKGHEESVRFTILFVTGALIGFISESRLRHEHQIVKLLKDTIVARRKAEKSLTIRDIFISVASHELKTPLTALTLNMYALENHLEKHRKNTHILKYVDQVNKQVARLSHLTDDLLNVSKIKTGKLSMEKEEVDFNTLTQKTVELVSSASPKYSIKIHGKVRNLVYCDPNRISQVITNLLTNAVKYSPDQKKVIVYLKDHGEDIEVHIKDFGIGIPRTHLKDVFKKFYRVQSTEKIFSGFGIGLYICSEIVKRHQGNMWVESTPHKGSTFCFSIPKKEN